MTPERESPESAGLPSGDDVLGPVALGIGIIPLVGVVLTMTFC